MDEIVQLGRAIAHSGRIRILKLLLDSDRCTCELIAALSATSRSSLDKHLNELERLQIIEGSRSGRWMHYHIKESVKPVLKVMFDVFATAEDWDFKDDEGRLRHYTDSPQRVIC